MDMGPILIAGISALSGTAVGLFSASKKGTSDNLVASVSKDEVILVHYDKIVDQLQEEVARLRVENDDLQKRNLELEKSLFQTNKQMFEITKELSELKEWMRKETMGRTPR